MGAQAFIDVEKGESAIRAFSKCRDDASHEHGSGGYTGTIAEKGEIVMINPGQPAEGVSLTQHCYDLAQKMLDDDDPRISDKWGPAGCFDLKDGSYMFFGLASS